MVQSARMNISVWPITLRFEKCLRNSILRSTNLDPFEGQQQEESGLNAYAFKLNMEGRLDDVNSSFKLDLSKQACSNLDNSCDFEYELLQDDDVR